MVHNGYMNKATLDRLKNNPHYVMSEKQRREADEESRQSMIEFGEVQTHDASFEMTRVARNQNTPTKEPHVTETR